MCFNISENKRHINVKIARRNIPCYKLLEKDGRHYRSPHYEELYFDNYDPHYPKNKVVEVRKKVKNFQICSWGTERSITQGLHSYSIPSAAQSDLLLANRRDLIYYSNSRRLFKAYIPKGTKYYYNPVEKEYVSLELVVVKTSKADVCSKSDIWKH